MTDEQFDKLITKAMNELPQEYIRGLQNVAIVMADEPSSNQRKKIGVTRNNLLLGLYEGIPLTQRGASYNLVLPDKITLFKNPLMELSKNENDLLNNIKRTLWHEIAHFYGLNHDRINYLRRKLKS
ncbi:MAG TPA: metallopeptidase family protein [Candidatus Saccharibacteria bacterium]|nr:metallopeptidase family protein [Candidatus Saccharibacteria bacterium]